MASIVVNGDTSGAVTLSAPAVAGTVTVTLPSTSGTMASLASVTANGVAYVNSSSQPTSGSALVFDGTNLGLGSASLSSSSGRTDFTLNGASSGGIISFGNGGVRKGYIYQDSTDFTIANEVSAGVLRFSTNGSERMRLNTSGTVILQGGSTSATGVGITFPATQSASSDANTLDDYEEGTWTPTDGSGAGLSLTVANAVYIKIGQMVYVATRITFPTTSSSANVQINGLPFTAPSVTGGYWGGGFRYTDYTVFFVVGVSPSSSVFQFYNLNNLGVTNAQASTKTFDLVFMFRATA